MDQKRIGQGDQWREKRRRQAVELKQKGWSQAKIAEAFGVTEGAVSQWMKTARTQGEEALRAKGRPGRCSELRPEQRERLQELLAEGAEAHGYGDGIWTGLCVAKLIGDQFGIAFSERHSTRILSEIGYSRQKPVRRASERDEEGIAAWGDEELAEIKKSLIAKK